MKLLRFLLVFPALFFVAFLRFSPFKIRLGVLMADRIGHLAGNTEVYLCEKEAGLQKGFDIWGHFKPANDYLLKMWKRVMRIDSTGFLIIVMKVNRLFPNWQSYEINAGNYDRDVNNLFEKSPPHLTFTEEEKARGEAGLRKLGIPKGAKWVCLIVRDSAYLPELGYHAYRDSDINDYGPAAVSLAKQGYYVLRMGAKVNKPWPKFHSKVIDYASNHRSEFMDIYLGANCEFCISTGCGFDAIPYIFRRPIVYVNFAPLEYLFTFRPSLAIWKHHYRNGKRMTVKEIADSGAGRFMMKEEFEEAGITLKDNTPEEIKEVVMEMASGLSTTPQDQFWADFPRSLSMVGKPLHGEIRMRIGQKFLERYDPLPELYQSHDDDFSQWERGFHAS